MIPASFCMYAIAVQLLSRVFDMLHEEVSTERPRTVMMRHPQLLAQGTQITICLDFAHLCTTYDPPLVFLFPSWPMYPYFLKLCLFRMHRKPGHVIKFLLGQMETKGWLNKQHQLEMKGFVSSQHFQAVFQRYIGMFFLYHFPLFALEVLSDMYTFVLDAFVICSCCKSPDTALAEDNGISTLSCEMVSRIIMFASA